MDLLYFFEDNVDEEKGTVSFLELKPVLQTCAEEQVKFLEETEGRPVTKEEKSGVEKTIDEKAFSMVIGAVKYFRKTIYNNDTTKSKLNDDIVIFYMCSFLNPIAFRSKHNDIWPDFDESIRTYIEPLSIFTPQQIDQMSGEWKNYWRAVQAIPPSDRDDSPNYRMKVAHEFWKENRGKGLTSLALLARYAFTVVPSSAAAERVFSVLKNSLSLVQMHQALEDLTELMIQLQYNHRHDKWDWVDA